MESARACLTYACTLGNDEGEGRHAAASGRPSWLTSSRAPSTQPRNADFLVAIAPYFLLLFPDSPSLPLFLTPRTFLFLSLRVPFAYPLFPFFFLFSHYTHRQRYYHIQTLAFRLRNEAKHPTRDV